MGSSGAEIEWEECVRSHATFIAIRYNRWFRNTAAQDSYRHGQTDGTPIVVNRSTEIIKGKRNYLIQILQPCTPAKFWTPVAILRWRRKCFWPTARWAGRSCLAVRPRASMKPS